MPNDTDATNWVTVRVPEADRDAALDTRPNDATHGDCLRAGAKALAGEHGDSDGDSHDALIDALDDALPDDGALDATAIAAEVTRRLDYAELAKQTADEIEGRWG